MNKHLDGRSLRLARWNYGWDAYYFVTMCTRDRVRYFGEVIDGSIHLSDIGQIVAEEWARTPDIPRAAEVGLGEFIIMPDHLHGIIAIHARSSEHHRPARDEDYVNGRLNTFGPQRSNLASILRGFKCAVTSRARMNHPDFRWQPKYYEHIVRSAEDLERIESYIRENPKRWKP